MAVLRVDNKPPRNRGVEACKLLLKMVIELALRDIVLDVNGICRRTRNRANAYKTDALSFFNNECKGFCDICWLDYNRIKSYLEEGGYFD